MRLQPGDSFERYTIEKLLGEGGMGEVYRARDTRLHRRVALKVLRKTPGADSESWDKAAARILREARAAAALSHPNTVALYDVSEHDGSPFLAMELVEGKPLRAYVGTDVPQSSVLRWLLDVAYALAAAHRAGIVHRDVKPENVMLRDDGMIKVLDFGIARRLRVAPEAAVTSPEGAVSTLTGPGLLVGTPAYMAPEQIRGEELDGRADQFSWGVLAHELLSGRVPFGPGRDALGIIAAVLGELPPPLEGVPEVIKIVVERALSKRREDRFASMDELIALLEPFITGEMAPPSSRRLSGPPRLSWPPSAAAGAAEGNPTISAGGNGDRVSAGGGNGDRVSAGGAGGARGAATTISAVQGEAKASVQVHRRRRWLLGVALVAALAGGAVVSRRWAAPPAPPAPVAPPSPTPAPTPVTALPPPKTQSPQALAAYQEGLQGFRDARWHAAHAAFKQAVALDPSFAAAHLRLAQTTLWFGTVSEARSTFQRAIALRTSLGARDQAFIEVLEPYILRDPPNVTEVLSRIREMVQRYPTDAELLAFQSSLRDLQTPEEVLDLTQRCTTLDPQYADCWQLRASALSKLGREKEAVDALDHCIDISPSAADCLNQRASLHERAGRCDLFEEDTRRQLAQVPVTLSTYLNLAAALYALGRPLPAVRAVLKQGMDRANGPDGDFRKLQFDSYLFLLEGDLRGAEQTARESARRLAHDPSEWRNLVLWELLVRLNQEMGREEQAARLADEFMNNREVLLRTPSQLLTHDPTLVMLKAKLRGGLLNQQQYKASRREWLRARERTLGGASPFDVWLNAYALPASTTEDALEALQEQTIEAPLPSTSTDPNVDAVLGKVYMLAGRPAKALPYLGAVARSCAALKNPVVHTVSHYHLGMALESQGDVSGACAAYRVVMKRWPDVSVSTSAKAASARVRHLDCPH